MLEISGVHAGYGPVRVLHGIDLRVAEGEIVTLIGNNGAGKSTTLKSIVGIVKAAEGSIRFRGREISRLRPDQVVERGIRLVPEGRRIFAPLTVRENLALGGYKLTSRAELKRQIERTVELFPRLGERIGQQAGTLSGGEQQMLAVARALMTRPELLILDEPSMGLSPMMVETVFQVIDDVHRAGTTLLLVEQNADLALDVADRAYVMESGRIALAGAAEELRSSEQVRKAYLGDGADEQVGTG